MLTKDALGYFGSKSKLASAAGVKIQSIYNWGELVPEARALRLQIASGGELVYDSAVYDAHAKAKHAKGLNHENHPND